MAITHAFVSAVADGEDTTLVRPSDWNAAHTLAGEGARVYHNANQSTTDGTWTTLAFNSEKKDTDAIHDNSTNNSRLTCKTAGAYLIIGMVYWAANAAGRRIIQIAFSDGVATGYINAMNVGTAEPHAMQVSAIKDLAVNEYVELKVFQASGGALNVLYDAGFSPDFMMQRIG